ncbi:MAG TPA: glycosyltransferase family 39 protein [Terriglobales bacterium]|nr:glycosyltransferase family 39 protein [Terriglobales bacterium]HUK49331.1 glycosyltransferase family 39 protein [Terriglobales bacterium]
MSANTPASVLNANVRPAEFNVAATPDGKDSGRDWLTRHWRAALFFLFLIAFAVRLVFLEVAPNNTTDAWSRYHYAVLWLQNPTHLPIATSSDAWLPLHIWLLGVVLWLAKTETATRVFTALLGSLTVVLCASIFARIFSRRVGFVSALLLALFGFHVAFSITTSSEVPTIFFLAAGMYGWVRYAADDGRLWLALSGLALGAACLCRFEAWLVAPVLAFMLLPLVGGSPEGSLKKAVKFAVVGCAASIFWLFFSLAKWGDALELPHRTMWLNANFRPAVLHHGMVFRAFAVPGSLLISLSPLILTLAFVGVIAVIARGPSIARAIAFVLIVLLLFNWWNSIRYETTQARYTLLYSWLFIPFAYESLCRLSKRWRWIAGRAAFAGVAAFFVIWQAGIILGAKYAPPVVADRLGVMSPLVPLGHELRALTDWLKLNVHTGKAIVLDDFNWDSPAIARFGNLDGESTLEIRQQDYADRLFLKATLNQFIATRRPGIVICSPYGPIGEIWKVDSQTQISIGNPAMMLDLQWQSEHWRIYKISYPASESQALLSR